MSTWLITGDDPVLVSEAVSTLTDDLVGAADRALTLNHFDEGDMRLPEGGWSLAPLVGAAQTPPFLSERRVVVGRHLARFGRAPAYASLIDLLGDMLTTTDLVLVWERGLEPAMAGRIPPTPKKLLNAVKAAGGTLVKTKPPARRNAYQKWLRDQIAASGLRFAPAASDALADLAGEDRGIVVGCLRTLQGAMGAGAAVAARDVYLYGGEPGSTTPWALGDAIDRGDIKTALEVLHRQLGTQNPFQLLFAQHTRYQRMLRLDGSGVTDEREAARILGMKGSTFPARKLLQQTRRLGSKRVARAICLLAEADLALRGTVDWPNDLVLEVLVARLAALSR